jgi:hypothetical protein
VTIRDDPLEQAAPGCPREGRALRSKKLMKDWTIVLLGIIAMLLVALLYALFLAPDR